MIPTGETRSPGLPCERSGVIEIRTYRLKPGTDAEFHRLVATESMPLHVQHGIEVVASGQSLDDPDTYVLMRAFKDLQHRASSLADFYASSAWRNGPREAIVALVLGDVHDVPPGFE